MRPCGDAWLYTTTSLFLSTQLAAKPHLRLLRDAMESGGVEERRATYRGQVLEPRPRSDRRTARGGTTAAGAASSPQYLVCVPTAPPCRAVLRCRGSPTACVGMDLPGLTPPQSLFLYTGRTPAPRPACAGRRSCTPASRGRWSRWAAWTRPHPRCGLARGGHIPPRPAIFRHGSVTAKSPRSPAPPVRPRSYHPGRPWMHICAHADAPPDPCPPLSQHSWCSST